MYHFTVFTPTYNRENTITNTYKSLLSQVHKDFEWVIVDDGSSDNTKELVDSFIQENQLSIQYIYQENQGKHIAQNNALDWARGILFLPLDSDDTLLPDALEIMWNDWRTLTDDSFSGLGYHCQDKNGNIIGSLWPEDGMVSNDLEMKFKYSIAGEKYGPIRTDIMREFKNPQINGHFFSENTVWFKIAEKYKKKYYNKAVRVYEVQEDSVSRKSKQMNRYNLERKYYSGLIYINDYWKWFLKYKKVEGLKQVLRVLKNGVLMGKSVLTGNQAIINDVTPLSAKMIVVVAAWTKLIYQLI